jgi:DMSO/TMAO reductase YedYZ molybdopterin-dependent catalytic subunit
MFEDRRGKLPPGQQLLRPGRWPPVGEKPPAGPFHTWTLQLRGLFNTPRSIPLEQLLAEPLEDQSIDIHCVTRWSRLGVAFRGIPLARLLSPDQIDPRAQYVSFVARSSRGHSSSISLEVAQTALLALYAEGKPLSAEYGGPLRVIVPDRYFYKSVKWLEAIELLEEDQLGYWERDAGYHNRADPWIEERYLASGVNKRQANQLIASRDFSNLDLMGIDASDRDLSSLTAINALLRNANFTRSNLTAANFNGANLANAHFIDANLQNALLQGADLEGANLIGADLRGADLRDASLFGADFISLSNPERHAILNNKTLLSRAQIKLLADQQEAFLEDKTTLP